MTTLTKYDAESYIYTFNFALKLATNDTLSGVPLVTVSPAGPTLGTPTVTDASLKVSLRISGGTLNATYLMKCVCGTTNGDTAEIEGNLKLNAT